MKEILKMIETVDPNDTAKMDEIDARVWCYLHQHTYIGMDEGSGFSIKYRHKDGYETASILFGIIKYTRSRDALKAIRPEGRFFEITKYPSAASFASDGFHARWYVDGRLQPQPELPTEELAELHAIIQAIAYERAQKEG